MAMLKSERAARVATLFFEIPVAESLKSLIGDSFGPRCTLQGPKRVRKPGSGTERGSQGSRSAPGGAPGASSEEFRGAVWGLREP